MSSLTLVSKRFYRSARGLLDRNQIFNLKQYEIGSDGMTQDAQKSSDYIKALLSDPGKSHVLRNIRFIILQTSRGSKWPMTRRRRYLQTVVLKEEELEKKFVDVVELIKKLPKLKKLTFKGDDRVPLMLINALQEYHPCASLHVERWSRIRGDEDHNNRVEVALAKSPNLRSISARFWNDPDVWASTKEHDLRIPAFKRIVALAPNLESVGVSQGRTGCVRPYYTSEQRQETRRRAQLFFVEQPSPNSIKSLVSHGGDFATSFEDVTDISKLERLQSSNIPRPDYFAKEGVPNDRFQSLSHLSLTMSRHPRLPRLPFHECNDAASQFLTSCPPLESLCIKTWFKTISLSDILLRHGSTLRNLSLHEAETTSLEEPRKILSKMQLEEIRRACPLLEDIEVDINRSSDGKSEFELFSSLAGLAKLKIFRLYIDLGIAHEDRRMSVPDRKKMTYEENPFFIENPGWLERIWAIIQSEKGKNQSVPLKELHVKVGEWDRNVSGGLPTHWVTWERSNRKYLRATASDRDDRPDEIAVIRGPDRGGDDSTVKSWEARPVPSDWRFGDKWEVLQTVGEFEARPSVARGAINGI